MLTSVEVYNAVGAFKALIPVTAIQNDSPYVITEIGGIGPVKADILTSPYANQAGGFFQSARTGQRNITFKMAYGSVSKTGKTVETLRRELYSIFPPEGGLTLKFFNSEPGAPNDVDIVGYVESIMPNIFSKEPEVMVSIICPKPYFYKPDFLTRTGWTRESLVVPYQGDAPVGFQAQLVVYSDITKVIISNGRVDEDMVMEFPQPNHLRLGDQLIVQTISGEKRLYIIRSTYTIPALDNLTYGSLSMQLDANVNTFVVDVVPVAGQTGIMPFTMTCQTSYLGL
ncbi:minor tail protein [Arthrobacter phage Heisenberger]|uniref:Minor tail protein n=1 Tax=Arthrobacter phage Heisenberger TaxID=2024277 RepID=A0A222Z8X5_9CAUD|nr:minor tail protein [Arthrobacter phage Heisenberger]ASR80276.1 minor tail protein [Arthrobacter phage Heisenberger]